MRITAIGALPILILASGCAREPDLYPVSGTIVRDGKPVGSGGLLLQLESAAWNGRVVNANVNADGTFTVETSVTTGTETTIRPGAPAGTYKVFYHPPSVGQQKVGTEIELPERIIVEAKDNVLALVVPEKKPAPANAEKPADDKP